MDYISDYLVMDDGLLILDGGSKKLNKYNLNTLELLSSSDIPFHSVAFNYQPELEKFIFYIPNDNHICSEHALVITDEQFNILSSHMNVDKSSLIIAVHPHHRVQRNNNGFYYNPANTGLIYLIDFDGNETVVFNLGTSVKDLSIYDVVDEELIANIDQMNQLFPISEFYVGSQEILIASYQGKARVTSHFLLPDHSLTDRYHYKSLAFSGVEKIDFRPWFPTSSNLQDEMLFVYNGGLLNALHDHIEDPSLLTPYPFIDGENDHQLMIRRGTFLTGMQ